MSIFLEFLAAILCDFIKFDISLGTAGERAEFGGRCSSPDSTYSRAEHVVAFTQCGQSYILVVSMIMMGRV